MVLQILLQKISNLLSDTQSFIKDSSQFIGNIKKTKMKEADLLDSFDVVSLHTKIAVKDAMKVIRRPINRERSYLVELSLKSTFFSF